MKPGVRDYTKPSAIQGLNSGQLDNLPQAAQPPGDGPPGLKMKKMNTEYGSWQCPARLFNLRM